MGIIKKIDWAIIVSALVLTCVVMPTQIKKNQVFAITDGESYVKQFQVTVESEDSQQRRLQINRAAADAYLAVQDFLTSKPAIKGSELVGQTVNVISKIR